MPPLDAKVADMAPDEPTLTPYDEQHAVTYVRLLDAETDNADWQEVARIVLHIDPAARSRLAPAVLSTVIWLARSGWHATAIVISRRADGRRTNDEDLFEANVTSC